MNCCSKTERHWNARTQTQIAVLEDVFKLTSADPFRGLGVPEFMSKKEGLQRALPDPCKETRSGAFFHPFQKPATIEGLEVERNINHLPHGP